MEVYGFDKEEPWQRNVPALLYQLGAGQHFIPQDVAIDKKLFSNGIFKFDSGRENNPAVQDLYDQPERRPNQETIAPALLINPKRLDGTSAPSYDAAEKPLSIHGAGNIRDADHAERMRNRFKSPHNQPRMGEANNGKASLFATFDPRVNNKSEAMIIVASEARANTGQTRNKLHERTRFDSRHDSALHFKATQQFQVLELVRLGEEDHTVNNVDELQITNESGQRLTQQWLDDHLDFLNGIKERLKLIVIG